MKNWIGTIQTNDKPLKRVGGLTFQLKNQMNLKQIKQGNYTSYQIFNKTVQVGQIVKNIINNKANGWKIYDMECNKLGTYTNLRDAKSAAARKF